MSLTTEQINYVLSIVNDACWQSMDNGVSFQQASKFKETIARKLNQECKDVTTLNWSGDPVEISAPENNTEQNK